MHCNNISGVSFCVRAAYEAMHVLQRSTGRVQEGANGALCLGDRRHGCGSGDPSGAPALHRSGSWSFGGVACLALEWLDPVVLLQGLGPCPLVRNALICRKPLFRQFVHYGIRVVILVCIVEQRF